MTELPWEDSLLERKVESDLKDLLKTLVAFANSVRPDHVATLLIGEKNDGSVQGVANPDGIQKTVRKECERIYPSLEGAWQSRVYEKDGKSCVRVEIEYSGETPHFGGAAWVRRGSASIPASDEEFQRLIDLRSSKVRELTKWLGREITVEGDMGTVSLQERSLHGHPRWHGKHGAILASVNNFWATFDKKSRLPVPEKQSEPLKKLLLSWDDTENRLKVLVEL